MLRQVGVQHAPGDTILAHITRSQAGFLKAQGGSGRINPITGLPHYDDGGGGDGGDGGDGGAGGGGGGSGDGDGGPGVGGDGAGGQGSGSSGNGGPSAGTGAESGPGAGNGVGADSSPGNSENTGAPSEEDTQDTSISNAPSPDTDPGPGPTNDLGLSQEAMSALSTAISQMGLTAPAPNTAPSPETPEAPNTAPDQSLSEHDFGVSPNFLDELYNFMMDHPTLTNVALGLLGFVAPQVAAPLGIGRAALSEYENPNVSNFANVAQSLANVFGQPEIGLGIGLANSLANNNPGQVANVGVEHGLAQASPALSLAYSAFAAPDVSNAINGYASAAGPSSSQGAGDNSSGGGGYDTALASNTQYQTSPSYSPATPAAGSGQSSPLGPQDAILSTGENGPRQNVWNSDSLRAMDAIGV